MEKRQRATGPGLVWVDIMPRERRCVYIENKPSPMEKAPNADGMVALMARGGAAASDAVMRG